ncbi:MAG: hypothetical protein ACE5HT_09115 [Gemmatimonadales bacterium]
MNDHFAPTEKNLIERFRDTVRGPRRNGLFALWLLVRTCDGVLPPDPLTPRSHRRRLDGLRRRLSSLSLNPPLRTAFNRGMDLLQDGSVESAVWTLRALVAPVSDTLGTDAGHSITAALRAAESLNAATNKS